ncbi:P-type conjugative transfer protein TrbL [Phocoenobacter uteri]|uniref:P-type conjugative transfer protein TrbL n=1 Tax=Phocoenobacter uteri TaxID=146806 RepID=UPI0024416C18|nr:P-type conjugative transfer protein TrbL [Phocoenobacter uteri]
MTINKKYLNLFFLLFGIFLILYSQEAAADTSVLNSVVTQFKDKAATWSGKIIIAAKFLFYSLGVISLSWTLGYMLIKKAEIGELFGELIKFVVFFGFMYYILINATDIGSDIIDSFTELADKAGGNNNPTTASSIVDIGYDLFIATTKKGSFWSPVESSIIIFTALIIFIALCYIAASFVTLQITAYVTLNAGIFVLGFGGSKWTSDMAINYYKTLIGLGLQLFTMILIVTTGKNIMIDYKTLMGSNISFENLAIMLLTSIFLLLTSSKIPPMIGGLINGATGNTNFGGAGMALAGFAAAATAASAALAGAAASLAKATVGNVGGAAQTVSAAMNAASGGTEDSSTPNISNIADDVASSTQGGANESMQGSNSSSGQDGTSGSSGESMQGSEGSSGQDGTSGEPGESMQGSEGSSGQDGRDGESMSDLNDSSENNRESEYKNDSGEQNNNSKNISNSESSSTQKPLSFSEKVKQATQAAGLIGGAIKTDAIQSAKGSLNNLVSNSYMGKIASNIKEANTASEGTGSISSPNISSTSKNNTEE